MEIDSSALTETQKQKVQKLVQLLDVLQKSKDHHQREDALTLINNLLSGSDATQLLNTKEVKPYLFEGLKHLQTDVGRLALIAFMKCAENPNSLGIMDDQNVLNVFLETVKSSNIGIADQIAEIFKKISIHSNGLRILFHNNSVSEFKKLISSNETVKFRILDLFASVSSISKEAFQYCESNSFLQEIVSTVETSEVLQQLNGIELLQKVVASHEGVLFLEKTNTFARLVSILNAEDPLISLIRPRIINFFGNLAVRGEFQAGYIDKLNLLPVLKKILDEGSQEEQGSVIASLGQIGSNAVGLVLLSKNQTLIEDYLHYINVETDLRIGLLHSLAFLLKTIAKIPNFNSSTILQPLLENIKDRKGRHGAISMIIMPLLRQPFTELRYASLDFISALVLHRFGLQMMLQYPGFYEHITNRSAEETKTGKEWQYTIIQNMVLTIEHNQDIIERSKWNELSRYLKDGVFYIKAESRPEYATKEGGS